MYSPLLELCPRLGRALRPLPLVERPTPVEPLVRLGARLGRGELWIKRDDRTNPEYGGNKPRKLAWLLARAPLTTFARRGVIRPGQPQAVRAGRATRRKEAGTWRKASTRSS